MTIGNIWVVMTPVHYKDGDTHRLDVHTPTSCVDNGSLILFAYSSTFVWHAPSLLLFLQHSGMCQSGAQSSTRGCLVVEYVDLQDSRTIDQPVALHVFP